MPLPKPQKGEARDKFVSRCVSAVFAEGTLHGSKLDKDSEKDRMRAVAACQTTWRGAKKSFVFRTAADVEAAMREEHDATKDVPLHDIAYQVESSWSEQHPNMDAGWVNQVFAKYCIVRKASQLFKVGYRPKAGGVTFDDESKWEQIEYEFVPAKSSIVAGSVIDITPNPIKAVEGKPGRFKCYGVLFGGPTQRDAVRQYFTKDTQFHLDWYKSYPWLHHHGRHPMVGTSKVGMWDAVGVDDIGVFIEGELDNSHKYKEAIETLVGEGVLYPSSRAVPDLVRVEPDGRITEWPITEFSSTVAPAEYRMAPISTVAVSAIRSIEGGNVNILEQLRDALAGVPGGEKSAAAPKGDTPGADTDPTAMTLDEVVSEVTKTLELDKFIKAIQSVDAVLKGLDGRIGTIEAVLEGVAKTELEKVKSLAEGSDWAKQLWAASKSGDVVPDAEAAKAAEAAKSTTTPAADATKQGGEISVARAIFKQAGDGVQGVQ